MSLNGKFLDKDHLQYFWTKIKMKFASAEQGAKADTAVQPSEMETALSGKQDTISDLSDIRSGASAGATAVQPSALNDYQTKLSGTNKLDPAYIEYDATHRAVTDTEKSTWNGKQSALTTEQLAAVNSGIDSADVAQIETNKNNISMLNKYGGGKNKFNIDTATIYPSNASYTKNSDGTINVTKSTNTIGQVAMLQAFLGETGTYIISGCPSGGSSTTYEMLIQSGDTVLARDYGEGASVSLTKGTEYQFKVVVRESQTLSNKLFKPMISVEGGDYQPYAFSNPVITPALIKQVDEGAKNLFDFETWASSLTGATRGTIAIQNQSITLTATGNDSFTTPQVNGFHIPVKPDTEYVVTVESTDNNGQLVLLENDAFSKFYTLDSGVGILRFKTSSSSNRLSARFGVPTSGNTSTISNVMICTAADWAVSQKFVPYAPTNRELYETKITMVDVFGLGKALTSGDDMDSLSLGHFACTNATIAGTVSHAPWSDGGFFGWTMTSIQTDRFVQIAIKNSDDFQIAKRQYYGTWSNWVYSITTPAST